ncbi:hypothetical protein [Terrisporobacter sp.]|uniref:hypothetical protein n=1 Tax=Terrisporobacter sp. TaxID=1965305 RepID=UPI00263064E4|nr:hypothetical protein [Terrisporobacter sp.]
MIIFDKKLGINVISKEIKNNKLPLFLNEKISNNVTSFFSSVSMTSDACKELDAPVFRHKKLRVYYK